MNKVELAEIVNITTGKLDSNAAVPNGKYKYFTCAPEPLYINEFAFDDDVILIAGNNAQGNFHINRFKGKFNAYQRTYVLTSKNGNNLDYIYYKLKLELKRLKNDAQGSQTKFLTMPILKNIKIEQLGSNIQKKIASVLSSLDDKIELNNKINVELEAMAKALYDYWFVQFEFPISDTEALEVTDKNVTSNGVEKPYKSSGRKMVYNDVLKREIPEGWEVKTMEGQIDFTRGISYTSSTMNDFEGIPMINLKSFNLNGTYRIDGLKYFTGKINKSKIISKNDLLIAITDVTREGEIIGRAILTPNFGMETTCSCDVARIDILNNSFTKNYLRYLFNSKHYHDYIKYFASGTLVLHLDLNGVLWYQDAIPPKYLQDRFEDFVNSIDLKIANNQKQNKELSTLRDWLLPMLMNGQVKVADAEEQVLGMVAESEENYNKTVILNKKESIEDRFQLWLSNQKLAARGGINETVLREIFDVMDDEDK